MVFFSSRHRIDDLPIYDKLWMFPLAYLLKYTAKGILFVIDRFDEVVTRKIINKGENIK